MIVRYKARALRDIERIHDYIAEFDPGAAFDRTAEYPASVRKAGRRYGNETVGRSRASVHVVHRVRDTAVDIIAVLHTARKRRS